MIRCLRKHRVDDDCTWLLSPHGLKATTGVTTLSWCAKAGVALEHRRVLGYRSKSDERMLHLYVSCTLREYDRILAEFRRGRLRIRSRQHPKWSMGGRQPWP
eukprot:6082465-Amphidinium_carterae.2